MVLKNIYRLLLLFLLSLAISTNGYSQAPGFHGKLFSASLGTTFNSTYLNFVSDDYLNDERIKSVLPPKINLSLEYAISQRTTVQAVGSFYPMPHTQFHVVNVNYGANSSTRIVDSFKLKSNMFSLALGFRRYSDFSHYGKFTNYGVSGNYYNTVIYPTIYRKTTSNNVVTNEEIEKIATGRQWTYNVAFFIGRGRKHVFANNTTLDYGVNFWLFFGQNSIPSVDENYRENLELVVDRMMVKRSQEAHMIEIFANFGILR